VGRLVSLTKERIRQIERKALQRCHDVVEAGEKALASVVRLG
jgi:DNA-directed RNA polymerase sigma subunit (sigma70/sigma32)